ncbi:phosphoserine aminotransferase protein [Rutstroemia sp. NJR-2017a BBW]|nr:phosphoserine aminotransferase protein [Rutstroemia sp. NJR-2017a BBW]
MPSRSEITYFGAGPALLPTDVLETAAGALVDYNGTGLGLAEHSHRSEIASDILNTTKSDLAKYLDVPDDYEILFMQGGGSGEFSATVYNMVGVWVEKKKQKILKDLGISADKEIPEDALVQELQKAVNEELKIDYLVTGSWSLKASQEAARLVGSEHVNVAADARKINDVDGVEFPGFPKRLEPSGEDDEPIVVADMSSNILSRRIPIKNFSLLFFGAQKNLGTTGITVVIIKKNLLPPAVATPAPTLLRKLGLPIGPIVLSYETIAKNNSLYNTLSIFDVYVAGQVLQKLLATFPNKVDGQEEVANKKASLIYAALDAHPEVYKVVPDKSARSRMNICFRVTAHENNADAEKAFLNGAVEKGLTGLKGHRSVGGIRASNYNSVPLEGAEKLADYIKSFASSAK